MHGEATDSACTSGALEPYAAEPLSAIHVPDLLVGETRAFRFYPRPLLPWWLLESSAL